MRSAMVYASDLLLWLRKDGHYIPDSRCYINPIDAPKTGHTNFTMKDKLTTRRPKKGTEEWFEEWFNKWPSHHRLYEELADTWKYPIMMAGPSEPKPNWPERTEDLLAPKTMPCPKHEARFLKERLVRPLPQRLLPSLINRVQNHAIPVRGPIDNGRIPHRFWPSDEREAKVEAAKKIKQTLRSKRGEKVPPRAPWIDKRKKRKRGDAKEAAVPSSKRFRLADSSSLRESSTPSSVLISPQVNVSEQLTRDPGVGQRIIIRLSCPSPATMTGSGSVNERMTCTQRLLDDDDITVLSPQDFTPGDLSQGGTRGGTRLRFSVPDSEGRRTVSVVRSS